MQSQAPLSITLFRGALIAGSLFLHSVTLQEGQCEEASKPAIDQIDEKLRPLKLPDLDGTEVSPLAPATGKFSLLIFTATECPIANAFSPEISRIASEFENKGITVYLVYTDPELDAPQIRHHLKDYALEPVVPILDIPQRLAKATGATHTPEASIIDSDGNQLYRGRINNRYAALGKARRHITKHDLRAAISSILSGKPITTSRTDVIGCYIPTLVSSTDEF